MTTNTLNFLTTLLDDSVIQALELNDAAPLLTFKTHLLAQLNTHNYELAKQILPVHMQKMWELHQTNQIKNFDYSNMLPTSNDLLWYVGQHTQTTHKFDFHGYTLHNLYTWLDEHDFNELEQLTAQEWYPTQALEVLKQFKLNGTGCARALKSLVPAVIPLLPYIQLSGESLSNVDCNIKDLYAVWAFVDKTNLTDEYIKERLLHVFKDNEQVSNTINQLSNLGISFLTPASLLNCLIKNNDPSIATEQFPEF